MVQVKFPQKRAKKKKNPKKKNPYNKILIKKNGTGKNLLKIP